MTEKQPVSLILGGTSGLGKEIAELCKINGDKVIVLGSSITKQYKRDDITYSPCDLRTMLSVNQLLNRLRFDEFGIINRFFWVAGRLLKGDLSQQYDHDALEVIDVNFRNSILVAKQIWGQMQVAKFESKFVVISSSSGVKARTDEAIYVATKHAQVGFTRSLGLENKNPNLKVSLFMPGGMKTPFWDKNPQVDYNSFLDPVEVARRVFNNITLQSDSYMEVEIPRHS